MMTVNRLRLRARTALHTWQAKRLIARVNSRQAAARANPGLDPRAGYDELTSVPFLATMALAALALWTDVGDYWPEVTAQAVAWAKAISALVVGA